MTGMAQKWPRGMQDLLSPMMEADESLLAATFAESRAPAAQHMELPGQADTIPKGDVVVAVTAQRLLVFPRKENQVFTPFAEVAPRDYYRVVYNSPVIGSPSLDILFVDGSHLWFGLPADNRGRWVANSAMDIAKGSGGGSPQGRQRGEDDVAIPARRNQGLVKADALTPVTLAEFEAIKRTKYRYLRCLDQKLWEDMADVLTEDCVATYSGGKYTYEGRDAILGFLRRTMGAETFHSSHRVHQPEIEFSGASRAIGVWAMDDVVVMTDYDLTVRGAGFYTDEYQRQDGVWQIAKTGYKRTYEEIQPRGNVEGLKLTASWWATDGQSQLEA